MARASIDPVIDGQWARVRARLRDEVGESTFQSWLKGLTLLSCEGGEAKLAVPTRFMRDWVRAHFADRLRALWEQENKSVKHVEIVVLTAQAQVQTESAAPTVPATAPPRDREIGRAHV